jgi:hypothetical protein
MPMLALLLAAGLGASAAPAAAAAAVPAPSAVRTGRNRTGEERLRGLLESIRSKHEKEQRDAIFGPGAAAELRDAVAKTTGPGKKLYADRLPGMAADPFDLCRDLEGCKEAPLSMHVEDDALINDAFVALARPWLNLQKARGREVKITADPGQGVVLALEGLLTQPTVTLEASPAPTGGFDVSLAEGRTAAAVYAAERSAALSRLADAAPKAQ